MDTFRAVPSNYNYFYYNFNYNLHLITFLQQKNRERAQIKNYRGKK